MQPRKRAVPPARSVKHEADAALAALKRLGSRSYRAGMGRYGITGATADTAFGVPMGQIQRYAKQVSRGRESGDRHALAEALWQTAQYEARMFAVFVDDARAVTAGQMDRWCRDFEDWAVCDTACFKLFDRVPLDLAFRKVKQWSARKPEFERRAAFALLASLALHHKPREADEEKFMGSLALIERAAVDERNFVKKGVSWALRGVGRRTPALRAAAIALAERLAASEDAAARWIGRDARRDLTKDA